MNSLKIMGKFLDQPLLIAKFQKSVPAILVGGATLYTAKSVKKEQAPSEKKNTALRLGVTLASTIASALLAQRLTNKMFHIESVGVRQIKANNSKLIDEFVKTKTSNPETQRVLNKAKSKVLSYKEIKLLSQESPEFINKLIPEPENISSTEIFSEIGRLSILGFIPVVGGILGGIVGDKLTTEDWISRIPNKIKEGIYQYLANIFLCNIGAGAALALMEKNKVSSKNTRALGMVGGIMTTGVIGGSVIANFIGNRFVNPMFGSRTTKEGYKERKPEPLDIGLHVDDVATVAVMSGLKWIEPALPCMYAISGFRAGIGYRGNND